MQSIAWLINLLFDSYNGMLWAIFAETVYSRRGKGDEWRQGRKLKQMGNEKGAEVGNFKSSCHT
jgi:hypothetical protein